VWGLVSNVNVPKLMAHQLTLYCPLFSLQKLQGTSGLQTLTAKQWLSRQSLLLCFFESLPGRRHTNRAAFEFGNFHLMSLAFADGL
jgi:hypothetical protein